MSLKIAGEIAVHISVGEIHVNHLPLLSYHRFQRAVKVKLLYTSTSIPVKTTKIQNPVWASRVSLH